MDYKSIVIRYIYSLSVTWLESQLNTLSNWIETIPSMKTIILNKLNWNRKRWIWVQSSNEKRFYIAMVGKWKRYSIDVIRFYYTKGELSPKSNTFQLGWLICLMATCLEWPSMALRFWIWFTTISGLNGIHSHKNKSHIELTPAHSVISIETMLITWDAGISMQRDFLLIQDIVKCWPAATGIVFGIRTK